MKRFLGVVFTMFAAVAAAQPAEVYPPEYWALRSTTSNVQLSPDGSHISLMRIPNRGADPVLEIYKTDALDEEPYRVSASPMELTSYNWVSNDNVVLQLRQVVRDDIEGFNRGVYENKVALLDVAEQEIRELREAGASIVGVLPANPDSILLAFYPKDASNRSEAAGQFGNYRARSFYEYNLKTNSKRLILRGNSAMGGFRFTSEGKPWMSRAFESGSGETIWYSRQDDEWVEVYRQSQDDFERFSVTMFDAANPDIWFVLANNGHDKVGLWEFNVQTKTFGELIYRRNDVDVWGIRMHSNNWGEPDTVAGISWFKDNFHFAYFDGEEEALNQQLASVIPNSGYTRIVSRSADGMTLVVSNTSDRDPGSYYLVRNGRLSRVGVAMPLLVGENLADVTRIEYQARDGRTIPAFVTTPQGEGPFPLIVMPHGGPFVGETVLFDKWAQMLANSGYMVLQPQYRGSMNYGLDHYMTAFVDGGQGGYQMQDDKDDGALHLVEQGLVDPDRMAMFGWSYGGYAALVAASREEQIYQCAVAGAAVADNILQLNYYVSRLEGAQLVEQRNFWRDSISPIDEVDNVNIPLLVIHGSVDQRVPLEHAERYLEALDQAGKSYQYLELDGADHFSNTLTYDHQLEFFSTMLDFLASDCGPGGL
ncbi:MAG: S9 family peptidase [Gammaproteobacteria bacterium]|nr:S9 family peptidase [Gammaproteobacteria bacterium]